MDETDELATTLAADSASPTATPSIRITARYRTVESLGRGGMGEVQLCRDERIGRELALKVALPTLAEEGRRRFIREALLQARLEHPAFVPVYDIVTDDRGDAYFTMRRIKGRTLRAILADGAPEVSRRRLLAALGQLCLAVDYAHSRGVVHRDIKPDNVMLGDFGEVYLLDWGIAKIADEPEPDREPLAPSAEPAAATQQGVLLGTLGYMPPEQLRGEHASLDRRADVYALGAVLFEVLAGERLHRGATLGELVESTLDRNLDRRPSSRGADVAPELDEMCARATAPERQLRYASARELGDALERYLEGDRDLALRRARAEELAARASEMLAAARHDVELRVAAGREAVRAVAFDPTHQGARYALASALADPPARAPASAIGEVEAERVEHEVLGMRRGVALLLPIELGLLAFFVVSGVREIVSAAAAIGLHFLGLTLYALGSRVWKSHATRFGTAAFVSVMLGNAFYTRWTSPWVALPMVVATLAVLGTLHVPARLRWPKVAMAIGSLIVPIALESAGWIAPTYAWSERGLEIEATMAAFPPEWFMVGHLAVVVAACAAVTFPVVDRARATELHVRSQRWLLDRVLARE